MPTFFLDRVDVINRKLPEDEYVTRWEEFEFLPGALEGLAVLAKRSARIIVVTNQRGIARGRFTEQDLAEVHGRMRAAVTSAGGRIDAIYYCPHLDGSCDCRKPRTGLFERAARDFPEIHPADSLVVGDSVSDLEVAARFGSSAALVAKGERRREVLQRAAKKGIRVDFCVGSLMELAETLTPDRAAAAVVGGRGVFQRA